MLTTAFYILIVFSVLGVLCFFIAKESPKGQFKSLPYNRLPGIMTANTLSSREAWIAAHKSMSPYFLLLAVYFSLCAVVNLILVWEDVAVNQQAIFVGSLMVGIAIFGLLVFLGDRVAAQHNK